MALVASLGLLHPQILSLEVVLFKGGRSRKGMAIYVPIGDLTGVDETRPVDAYDGIADFLVRCGARPMPSPAH